MNVKSIIKKAAKLIGLNDLVECIDVNDSDLLAKNESDLNDMVTAINMVNNNIAANYIELVGKTIVDRKSDIIPFNNITDKNIIEIKGVYVSGRVVDFKVLPDGLKVLKGDRLEILFSYFPDEVLLTDDIDYYTRLNELIFAQGVVGEYLFLKGAIDDAYMWDKKFKQSLINLLRPKRSSVIPARRWY